MPELFIITGSNGAGKSSIGANYLPENIKNNYLIFDGDKLFMQKQKELWAQGITAIKEAKKLAFQFVTETFEQLVENALRTNDNLVYEGHFTNNETWSVPKRFKNHNYTITLIFLGLDNPELSELRVLDRTNNEGGHYVGRNTIDDNFYGNLEKLNLHFPMIDNLLIVDTSTFTHTLLTHIVNNKIADSVPVNALPVWFITYLPLIVKRLLSGSD